MSAGAKGWESPSIDVLVVGAGPTGLSLAALLDAEGATIRIVDRLPDRTRESRALAIQPRTLEVLAGLGVGRTLSELGNRGARLEIHFARRTVSAELFRFGLEDTEYPYLLFLSQAVTERVLDDHLAAHEITVERGVELVDLRQDSEGVTCDLVGTDGRAEQVRARYVVGCDGPRSTVRRLAGIRFGGSTYPQDFVLADVEAHGITPGAAHAFVAERGLVFFFPLGRPTTWRVLAMRPPGDTPRTTTPALAEVQAISDACTHATVHLHDPEWMTNFRIHHRRAEHYRSGRIFVAGDAAHVHSPAGAQGMNTGIQDAANLAWKLAAAARRRTPDGLLDSYEGERAPVGRRVLRFTDRAFRIATSTGPVARLARTRVAPAVVPFVLRLALGHTSAVRMLTELDISYRDSALSRDRPGAPRSGPKAGDRLPDAPVMLGTEATTLHRAIGGPGFHLMLCGTGAWSDTALHALRREFDGIVTIHRLAGHGASDVLVDRSGTALRRLGMARAVGYLLVRPDGHIACRGSDLELDAVETYLRAWFTP